MNKIISFNSVKKSCANCSLSQQCLPRGLTQNALEKLQSIVQHEHVLKKGEVLFKIGQPFKYIYAIQSGSLKQFLPTNEGDEHIVSFHMPGELIGFDALGHNEHTCTAVVLESSSICKLPYTKLQELCTQVSGLAEHFMGLMSNEIADEHSMMLMLGKKSAEERLATFFLSLSTRFSKRGFSPNQFNLTMSRHDIGNYLGLAVETTSRCISHMHDENIIEADRKYIRILDMPRLLQLAGVGEHTYQLLGEQAD